MPPAFNILATLWAFFAWAAYTIGVTIGMYYLGQALFGQDLKEAEPREDARERMWNPRTTQSEGLSRAQCFGRNMHHGNIIGKWTDVDGDDREVLYLLLDHGDGPTKGNVADQIWLNDQPVSNFGSVVVQERVGTLDQTCMTGFEKAKLERTPNVELKKADEGDPYIYTTPNKFFDDIEYTVCFPDGLMKYRENGATCDHAVWWSVRIRIHPAGDWITLRAGYTWAQRTLPLFIKYTVNTQVPGTVTRGNQYDLEFKRTSADGQVRRLDRSFLRSVREVVNIAFTHPGKALTGIKAVATAQLCGNIDVKIIREDRLIPVYSDTETYTIEHSRNRAFITLALLTQPVIGGNGDTEEWVVEKYEGTPPANMDLAFFLDWADFCSTQVDDGYGDYEDRLACDIKVETATNIWDLVHDIAEIGRAKLWWAGNKLTGWIDKEVTAPTDLVTMDTIMARTWKNHWVIEDELAGTIEVFYNDKRQGYERVPAPWSNTSAGKYTRTIAIEGIGITTYGTAIHVANHALTRNQLIRNVNNFRQFKDAFLHKLGEVIRVQHKVPNWGQGYRVINCPTASTMTLDRTIVGVNADDLLYVKSYDEANKVVDLSVYTVASTAGKVVTIDETWSPTPIKNNSVAIGVDGAIVSRRITQMEPTVDNYFDVTMETYDPVLYDADDLDPVSPNPDYIWNAPPNVLTKPISHDDVVDLINLKTAPQPNIEIPWLSNCEWSGDSVDTVSWAKRDADEEIVFRLRGMDYEIDPAYNNETTDEFIYWDPTFTDRFRTTNLISVATAAGNWYMCRNVDGVAYPVNSMMVAHVGVLLAGFLKVGTADIDDLSVTTVKIADQAVTIPASAYTAGSMQIPGTEVTLQSVSLTATGAPVLIQFSGIATAQFTTDITFRIYRDTTKIYESLHNDLYGYYMSHAVSFNFSETPEAGEYTYYAKALASPEVGAIKNRSLFVIETKK